MVRSTGGRPRRRWVPWLLTGAAVTVGYGAGRGVGTRRSSGSRRPSPAGAPADLSARTVRDAVAARRFDTVFQPVFGLRDGRLLMVEALTRFGTEPEVCPSRWFRAAERWGLGVELELATIEAALRGSAALSDAVPLSVNASPATLADHRLERLLDAHPGRAVVVEVTEHAAVADYARMARAVARLRARGCRLAVDDAGAGFASLRHVVRLAPEIIKLDASLTQEIEHDRMRRALAASLVLFAHRIGSQLVVEGIERAEDLAVWQQLGADGAQGYLLARPGPLGSWPDGPVLVEAATRSVPIRSVGSPRTPWGGDPLP